MIGAKPPRRPEASPPVVKADMYEGLICAVLRGEKIEATKIETGEFEQNLLALSRYHGVVPLLYDELKRTSSWQNISVSLQAALRSGAAHEAALELHRNRETLRVLDALESQEIPTLLFKGGALAYSHYPSPALRARVDTDLLIRKADFEPALRILENLGYEFPRALSGISTAVACAKDRNAIDLHWSISNARIFARALTFDELHQRSTSPPRLSNNVHIPGPADALTIACVHRAAHLPDRLLVNGKLCRYGNRLIWLYDIHLLIKTMSPACWREFVALTERKKLSSFCFDALERAQRLFHSLVPPGVIHALDVNRAEERIPLSKLQNRTQFFISDFRVTPTWRERLSFLHRRLFPNSAYIRAMYHTKIRTPLPLLYLRRALRRFFELVVERR